MGVWLQTMNFVDDLHELIDELSEPDAEVALLILECPRLADPLDGSRPPSPIEHEDG